MENEGSTGYTLPDAVVVVLWAALGGLLMAGMLVVLEVGMASSSARLSQACEAALSTPSISVQVGVRGRLQVASDTVERAAEG